MTAKRPSGGQRTAAERQARRKLKIAAQGLKKVAVLVPESRVDEIRAIAEKMRNETT